MMVSYNYNQNRVMDFKKKELQFKKLSTKIRKNKKMISSIKKLGYFLMLLFIFVSFSSFYLKSSLQTENQLTSVFNVVLFISFLLMIVIHLFILNVEKENKRLDTKIYHLMKLKI